jgi:hypothetical protein
VNDEWDIRLWVSETTAICNRMYDGDDENSRGAQNAPDLSQRHRNILNVHQHIVSDGQIERLVCEW